MRILQVDSGREMRGGQYQVLFLMEGLARKGHQSLLLTPEGSPLEKAARESGLDSLPLTLATLWRQAREHDIVHTHTGRAHDLAALVAANPLVVARRVAFPIGSGWASKWKYNRGDRYIAVSRHVARKLTAAGVPESRIRVVYDGVPLLNPADGRKILASATDDPMKGTALLKRAAGQAGISVKFSADLTADLADAAIFVYLSQEEGLGSAALLGMSAGLPVVASRVGGLEEIVEDSVTGLLVDNEESAVVNAIQRLLADPALASQMGRRARQRVEERYTVEHMVQQTVDVYEEVSR